MILAHAEPFFLRFHNPLNCDRDSYVCRLFALCIHMGDLCVIHMGDLCVVHMLDLRVIRMGDLFVMGDLLLYT